MSTIKQHLSKIVAGVVVTFVCTGILWAFSDRIHVSETYSTKKEVQEKCNAVQKSCDDNINSIKALIKSNYKELKEDVVDLKGDIERTNDRLDTIIDLLITGEIDNERTDRLEEN